MMSTSVKRSNEYMYTAGGSSKSNFYLHIILWMHFNLKQMITLF